MTKLDPENDDSTSDVLINRNGDNYASATPIMINHDVEGVALVGRFIFHHENDLYADAELDVMRNDQFDIGRTDLKRIWGTIDSTISTHRLRVRCVVYEENSEDPVHGPNPPKIQSMVYVSVLSTRPACLIRAGDKVNPGETVLRKFDGDVLLDDGDTVKLNSDISITFKSLEQHSTAQGKSADRAITNFNEESKHYRVTNRLLGFGGHAKVVVAEHHPSRRQLACKIITIDRGQLNQDLASNKHQIGITTTTIDTQKCKWQTRLLRELNVLKRLTHPNIVQIEKAVLMGERMFLFQELLTGGDLLSYIDRQGALNEAQTIAIVRQVLEAVAYMHSNGIVHRDIKPENILLTSWEVGARLVLADFGSAGLLPYADAAGDVCNVTRMFSVVGTYGYMAPEVYHRLERKGKYQNGYCAAIDIWSIGSVTATLLTNALMFPEQGKGLHDKKGGNSSQHRDSSWISNFETLQASETWNGVSNNARQFVCKCLNVNENGRFTAKAALADKWLRHEKYRKAADDAYQRAIEDWKPFEDFSVDDISVGNSCPDPYDVATSNNLYKPLAASKSSRSSSPQPSESRPGKILRAI